MCRKVQPLMKMIAGSALIRSPVGLVTRVHINVILQISVLAWSRYILMDGWYTNLVNIMFIRLRKKLWNEVGMRNNEKKLHVLHVTYFVLVIELISGIFIRYIFFNQLAIISSRDIHRSAHILKLANERARAGWSGPIRGRIVGGVNHTASQLV